jgi:hypothetical protein
MKRKRTMTKRKMRVLTPSLLQLNLGHLKTEVHQQAGPSKPHGHEQPLNHTVHALLAFARLFR